MALAFGAPSESGHVMWHQLAACSYVGGPCTSQPGVKGRLLRGGAHADLQRSASASVSPERRPGLYSGEVVRRIRQKSGSNALGHRGAPAKSEGSEM